MVVVSCDVHGVCLSSVRYFSRQPAPDALAIVEDYSLPSRAYLEALIVKGLC